MLLSDSAAGYKIHTLQHFSEYSKYIFSSSISALKYISRFTRLFGRGAADPGPAEKRLKIWIIKTIQV
ncbi:MAG TPA: hypothetical protein DC017_11685 [Candidatus Wallbacteria bacterium]|nr:hypothetical protein [Candidatus Wallbacteria bacterium]